MSKKFSITLDDGIHKDLVGLSRIDGALPASKAAFYVTTAILEARKNGELDKLLSEGSEAADLLRSFFDDVAAGRYYSDKNLAKLATEADIESSHLIAYQNCFKKEAAKVGK